MRKQLNGAAFWSQLSVIRCVIPLHARLVMSLYYDFNALLFFLNASPSLACFMIMLRKSLYCIELRVVILAMSYMEIWQAFVVITDVTETDSYNKNWFLAALNRDKWIESKEAFAEQWDITGF